MDDNVIMARTGHKRQAGLDRYKRPGLIKNVAKVSKILTLQTRRDDLNPEKVQMFTLALVVMLVAFILTRIFN